MSVLRRWHSRPRRVLLVFLLVCAVLTVAALGVPLGYVPGAMEKAVMVRVELEGASEVEVEREIVVPLEDGLAGLEGVEQILSTCERGRGRVIVRFLGDTDLEWAYGEVRAAVEATAAGFPARAQRPVIVKSDPDSAPVFGAAFPSGQIPGNPAGSLSEAALKRLYGGVEGVGEIQVGGAARYDVLVRFDPDRLAAAGLTPRDLVQAVRLHNVVGGLALPGQAPRAVDERFRTLEDLRRVSLGRRVRLGQVAEVELSPNTGQSIGRVNGGPRLLVFVQAAGDANTVALCRRLRRLTAALPEGEILIDQGSRIESALREVGYAVLAAVALVLLLTVLVERRLSAGLAVSLGLPVAALAALAAVRVCGLELDVVSLAGIAVGVGLAVDAGVVLVEEHFRLPRPGDRALESVLAPILLSAATTLVVFVPLGFAPPALRDSLGGLAVAVTAAVVASTAYVLFVLPVLLAGAGGAGSEAGVSAGAPTGGKPAEARRLRVSPVVPSMLRPLRGAYFGAARLRLPVALALAAAVGSAALVARTLPRPPLGLIPEESLRFSVEFPSGWTKEAVAGHAGEFESFLCGLEELRFVSVRYERERAAFYLVPHDPQELESVSARILAERRRLREGFLYLPSKNARKVSCDVVITGPELGALRRIAGELGGRARALPGVAGVVFHFKDPLPARVIEVDLIAATRAGLSPRELHEQLLWSLAAPVADKWTTGREERDIRIGAGNLAAHSSLRVPGSLSGKTGGAAAGGAEEGVLDNLLAGSVASPRAPIPLRSLVRLYDHRESGRIYRTNRQRSLSFEVSFGEVCLGEIFVAARQARRSGTGTRLSALSSPSSVRTAQLRRLLDSHPLPAEYRATLRSEDAAPPGLNRGLAGALPLTLVLLACVLMFHFESLPPVGIVMLQVPLSFVLPVFMLRLAGLPLSVPAMIGLLLTAGITVNNAILVLDAVWPRAGRAGAARPRSEGAGAERAGAVWARGDRAGADWARSHRQKALTVPGLFLGLTRRFRAILMASLTTVLGVVPLLFAGRAGQGLLAPLSVTIAAGVAGSLVALILSLAVVGRRLAAPSGS